MIAAGGGFAVGGGGGGGAAAAGGAHMHAAGGMEAGCAGACGGAEAMCIQSEGSVMTTEWRFVGAGRGGYEQMQNYSFVGQGCGSYEAEQVPVPYGWKVRPICSIGLLVALVVAGLVYLMQGTPTTTTTMLSTSPDPCLTGIGLTEVTKSMCCRTVGKYCTTTEPPTQPPTPPPQPPTTPPPTASLPFDCAVGFAAAWPEPKKTWCCQNQNKGCAPQTTAPPAPPSTCDIWGDPHINTFDKGHADFYGEGIKSLVKTSDLQIQARYKATPFTNGLAATNAVAIGGPVMQGHVLKIGPMENGQITFDNQVILTSFGSYSAAGVGTVTYNDQGDLVDGAMAHLQRNIVHMALPGGVQVQVMRWANHINLRIIMAPQPGQDGHCGNFNGNPGDDTTDAIRTRIGMGVAQPESLFRTYMAAVPGQRKTINDCEPATRAEADAACKAAGRSDLQACTFDYCFAGKQYVNEGM